LGSIVDSDDLGASTNSTGTLFDEKLRAEAAAKTRVDCSLHAKAQQALQLALAQQVTVRQQPVASAGGRKRQRQPQENEGGITKADSRFSSTPPENQNFQGRKDRLPKLHYLCAQKLHRLCILPLVPSPRLGHEYLSKIAPRNNKRMLRRTTSALKNSSGCLRKGCRFFKVLGGCRVWRGDYAMEETPNLRRGAKYRLL
jgi:hypothetical protein